MGVCIRVHKIHNKFPITQRWVSKARESTLPSPPLAPLYLSIAPSVSFALFVQIS